MIKFLKILNESIDIYPLDKLDSFANIIIYTENADGFEVSFSPKNSPNKYQLSIYKIDEYYEVQFGIVEKGMIKTSVLVNDNFTLSVLSIVFSLLRYYIDEYSVFVFEFEAYHIRPKLYNLYFDKNFTDYDKHKMGPNEFRFIKK